MKKSGELEIGDKMGKSNEQYLLDTEAETDDDESNKGKEMDSVEMMFKDTAIPPWKEQLTLRAFVVSAMLGIMFSFIVMKLNLTTGIIPSLNVAAGLLGFFMVKAWTKVLEQSGMLKDDTFTRQENTIIQTCVVATCGIAFSGTYVLIQLTCTLLITTFFSIKSAY